MKRKELARNWAPEQPATESALLENPAPWEAELASLREQLEAKEQEAKNNSIAMSTGSRSGEFKKRNARERDDAIALPTKPCSRSATDHR